MSYLTLLTILPRSLPVTGLGQEQPIGIPSGQSRTPGGKFVTTGLPLDKRRACDWAIEITSLHNKAEGSYSGWVPGKKVGQDYGSPQEACEAAMVKLGRQKLFDKLVVQKEGEVAAFVLAPSGNPAEAVYRIRNFVYRDARNAYEAAKIGQVYAASPRGPLLPRLKKIFPIFKSSKWGWEYGMQLLFPHTPATRCFSGLPRINVALGMDRSWSGSEGFKDGYKGVGTYIGHQSAPKGDPLKGLSVGNWDSWINGMMGEVKAETLTSVPDNTSACYWALGGSTDLLLNPIAPAFVSPEITSARLFMLEDLRKKGTLDAMNTYPPAITLFRKIFFDTAKYNAKTVAFYAERLATMAKAYYSIPWPMHDYGRLVLGGPYLTPEIEENFWKTSFWRDFLINGIPIKHRVYSKSGKGTV